MPDDTDKTGGAQDGPVTPPAADKNEPAPPQGGDIAPGNKLDGIVWDKIGTYTVDRTDKDTKDW